MAPNALVSELVFGAEAPRRRRAAVAVVLFAVTVGVSALLNAYSAVNVLESTR